MKFLKGYPLKYSPSIFQKYWKYFSLTTKVFSSFKNKYIHTCTCPLTARGEGRRGRGSVNALLDASVNYAFFYAPWYILASALNEAFLGKCPLSPPPLLRMLDLISAAFSAVVLSKSYQFFFIKKLIFLLILGWLKGACKKQIVFF